MATKLVTLPVVPGGVGAAEDTSILSSAKNVLASGVVGTLNIEARAAGGAWCQVATFKPGGVADMKVIVVCSEMRVSAAPGSSGTVQIIAEQSLIRSIDIPAPPTDGPGAIVDLTEFGPLTTAFVGSFTGKGQVWIELSGNGVDWETAWAFSANGCKTQSIAARYARAYGNQATAQLALSSEGDIDSGSVIATLIGISDSPYDAQIGETVLVDTCDGPVTINAPAGTVLGDTITVKDQAGCADQYPITIVPAGSDTMEASVINNAFDARTWISDGAGAWTGISDYDQMFGGATLVRDGSLVQVATSDDELQSLLFQMNEVLDLILIALEH